MTPNPRVILFGLDGATFDLLLPWAEAGYLPTFQRLLSEGTHGRLQSTNPPITPTAWTTCITGVTPEHHGVYDFLTPYRQDPAFAIVNSTMIHAPTLWELPGFQEQRCILLNVPYTYPVTPLNGLAISGLPASPGCDDFCYPADFRTVLERECGPLTLNVDIPEFDVESLSDARRFLTAIEAMFDCRCRLFRYLYETQRWDFFMPVFVFLDRVQHLFWKILDPATAGDWRDSRSVEIRDRVLALTQRLDSLLGEVVNSLKADDTLLLVSDHGFGPTDGWLNVNALLEKAGLLVWDPKVGRQSRLFYLAMKFGESRAARLAIPPEIRSAVRRKVRAGRSTFHSTLETAIDWTKTRAFFASIPSQGIYINVRQANGRGVVQPGLEYRRARDQVLEVLKNACAAQGGVPLEVTLKEDRAGPCAHLAPDIHFRIDNFRLLGRPLPGATSLWDDARQSPIGFHRPDGVFIAWGPSIRQGAEIARAQMLDVPATVFHLLNLPVPAHFQGQVLHSLWKIPRPECRVHAVQVRRSGLTKTAEPDLPQRLSATAEGKIMSELRHQGYFD